MVNQSKVARRVIRLVLPIVTLVVIGGQVLPPKHHQVFHLDQWPKLWHKQSCF